MSERSDKRHASHPEAWGWANTDDCSVDGKMHVRILIDEIERLRNLNTDYWHKIREENAALRDSAFRRAASRILEQTP